MKIGFHIPTINTPRLLLRPLCDEDTSDMFAFTSDPEVTQFVLWPRHTSLEDSRGFIRFLNSEHISSCGIIHHADRKLIGTCFFHSFHPQHNKTEIAFNIASSYWRQGYATETAKALVSHCFASWDINRIEATCMIDNHGSARVLEKIGMTFEGIMRQSHCRQQEFVDMKLYAILKSDYQTLNEYEDRTTPGLWQNSSVR